MSDGHIVKLKDYSLHFCGLFSFSKKQRKALVAQPFYSQTVADPPALDWIEKQYYPFFRGFVLNNTNIGQHIEICSTEQVPFRNCSFKDYRHHGTERESPLVNIGEVSLTFYNEQYGLGIYSFSMTIAQSIHETTLDDLTGLAKFCREFGNTIIYQGTACTIAGFIQDNFFGFDGIAYPITIVGKHSAGNYSGSKMKTWINADVGDISPAYSIDKALFEVATCGPIGSATLQPGDYTPSEKFLDVVLDTSLDVYRNWKCLCLSDSFTMLGIGYMDLGRNVWQKTYFKIYKFNLFCKFYLFKINADLASRGRFKVSRKELLGFTTRYNRGHISYNFLPNLIHQHIKDALGTKEELESLVYNIELQNSLAQEEKDSHLNWLLSLIAISSLISVLSDLGGVIGYLYGTANPPRYAVFVNTWIGLSIFILIGLYFLVRWSMLRQNR